MERSLAVIGVPSSAGAHMPGQEKAPAALRQAGLIEQLGKSGIGVVDFGDLPVVRHTADPDNRRHQNAQTVLQVAHAVADRIEQAVSDDLPVLVIGGDCTISLGVVSGFQRRSLGLGLLYFDAHGDLNTPTSSSSGAMDSMGMAHMLGEDGTVDALAHMGSRHPMLSEEQVVFYSYVPEELNPVEKETFERRHLVGFSADEVSADAPGTAAIALKEIERRTDRFVVHFDVDALDFVNAPLANIATINRGITLGDALASLEVFSASPQFAGLVITEINPNHCDEGGRTLRRFVGGIAEALA